MRVMNDGVGLALDAHGEGPDVLFVHGLGSAQVLFRPFIDRLADRYRCWNLDLRGHGASDRAPGAYGQADYASDVAAALDHIGRPTIGVGHSLGGNSLAFVAAGAHPGLTALYVLDSPLVRKPDQPSTSAAIFERQLAMLREFQPQNRPVADYEAVLGSAQNPVGGTNGDTMLPEQLRGRAESLSQLDPECIEILLGGQRGPSPAPTMTIPLRILAADPDRGASFRPEFAAIVREHAPQVEIRTIEGVGHQLMMMRDFAEPVFGDLERWLAEKTKR